MVMRQTARFVSWAALGAAAALALGGCDRDETNADSGGDQRLYPGATLHITVDHPTDLSATAELGVISVGGGAIVYHAPLESVVDRYSVTISETGEVVRQGTVTVGFPPAADLEILDGDDDGDAGESVRGRYGDVAFEAASQGNLTATAAFRGSGASDALEVVIAEGRGHMTWRGMRLDGYGPLSAAEAQALQELSTGDLAGALTRVPLDLGCQEGASALPLSLHAALIYPWQMILKYEIAARAPVIRQFLTESGCAFAGFAGSGEDEPLNGAIIWDMNHAIPMAHMIFPFDGVGEAGGAR
jgi:hypothetical protein